MKDNLVIVNERICVTSSNHNSLSFSQISLQVVEAIMLGTTSALDLASAFFIAFPRNKVLTIKDVIS